MQGPQWLDLNADEMPGDVVLPVEVRVKQGMALLDEKVPGWVQRIDVNTLDVADSCRCVIGQLYGDYDRDLPDWLVWGDYGPPDLGFHSRVPWSFDRPTSAQPRLADFAALTTEWKLAILARRMESPSA